MVEVESTFLILWSRFFHLVETPSSTLWRLVENQRAPQATRRSPHKKGNHAHREAWCHNLMVTTGRIVRKFACAPFLFHLSYSPLNRQVYTYACKVPIFLFHEMYYCSKKMHKLLWNFLCVRNQALSVRRCKKWYTKTADATCIEVCSVCRQWDLMFRYKNRPLLLPYYQL